jgi:hypothetical protein
MINFGILHWSYSPNGKWLTINSTDFTAIQKLVADISQYLSAHGNVRYKEFSAGGGSVMIENLTFNPSISANLEEFMVYLLNENGWVQDKNDKFNYKKIAGQR